jgi:hypothetical protein
MGNVEADASGNAKLDYVDHQISLSDDAKSALAARSWCTRNPTI